LTLKAVLEAGGYAVDSAASAAEAVGKMDGREYELVLSDLQMESPEAGLKVLAHARLMDYKPATALLTTYQTPTRPNDNRPTLIRSEDLPELLDKVANLISNRAVRIVERQLRQGWEPVRTFEEHAQNGCGVERATRRVSEFPD
jgi:two-component system, chemotaxis family, chemotaxis protein CheY